MCTSASVDPFNYSDGNVFSLTSFGRVRVDAVFVAMGLGFCLSLLFFMDQNISAAMVASPENRYAFTVSHSCN